MSIRTLEVILSGSFSLKPYFASLGKSGVITVYRGSKVVGATKASASHFNSTDFRAAPFITKNFLVFLRNHKQVIILNLGTWTERKIQTTYPVIRLQEHPRGIFASTENELFLWDLNGKSLIPKLERPKLFYTVLLEPYQEDKYVVVTEEMPIRIAGRDLEVRSLDRGYLISKVRLKEEATGATSYLGNVILREGGYPQITFQEFKNEELSRVGFVRSLNHFYQPGPNVLSIYQVEEDAYYDPQRVWITFIPEPALGVLLPKTQSATRFVKRSGAAVLGLPSYVWNKTGVLEPTGDKLINTKDQLFVSGAPFLDFDRRVLRCVLLRRFPQLPKDLLNLVGTFL